MSHPAYYVVGIERHYYMSLGTQTCKIRSNVLDEMQAYCADGTKASTSVYIGFYFVTVVFFLYYLTTFNISNAINIYFISVLMYF